MAVLSCVYLILKRSDSPTQQHYNGVTLRWDKTQHEYIFAAAVVTLWGGFTQGALCVQNDFLVLGTHKMVNDMGC